MKQYVSLIFILLLIFNSWAQDPVYFNNIYNPENTYASGRSILQINNCYFGITGTESSSSNGISLALFKLDIQGNLLNWNIIGENNHHYFSGSIGGTLIVTDDENLAFACQVQDPSTVFGTLIKLDLNLDTIWKRDYYTENDWTMTIKVKQTDEGGFMIVGQVDPGEGYYYQILIIKTDSAGNEQWHQTYGSNWSEHGTDVIQTPDGGYLIGGYFWKPGYDHSLDAMVIKTDSLGNEEWTKYYGNPDVDDDMALVTMADDGNYLVATVYGDWIVSPQTRTGRIYLVKLNNEGATIWEKKIGPKMYHCNIRNVRETNNGDLITNGFYYSDTINDFMLDGWMYKFTQDGDSIWLQNYYYYHDPYATNILYDAYPTPDNGYIAIGKTRPGEPGNTNKMWIVKVDSMGCDTPGCFTTVISEEWLVKSEGKLRVWPNPAKNKLKVESEKFKVKSTKYIHIYNSQGLKVEEIKVPDGNKSIEVDVSKYTNGLYYLQYIQSNQIVETVKFIKN